MHFKVEGDKVNNISSMRALHLFTKDAAISVHEVHWVHTSPFWRRRGLSRYTMERTMNHPAAKKCSCSELGTGTRNVAHKLYRDYGFIDMAEAWDEWACELPGSVPVRLPTGVSFREHADGDGRRLRALWREVRGNTLNYNGLPRGEIDPSEFAYLAERKDELVGFISANYAGGDHAGITRFTVKEGDQHDGIADALLRLAHRAVSEAGAKQVRWYSAIEDDCIRGALHRAGCEQKPTGGVWMLQIRDLVQFVQEIAAVIEKRLAESDFKGWAGKIDLLGNRLRGRLTVSTGRVKASAPTSRPADIVMTCDDDTATRVALGRETPFQAYLQARMAIEPRMSESITKLLETVFPQVPLS